MKSYRSIVKIFLIYSFERADRRIAGIRGYNVIPGRFAPWTAGLLIVGESLIALAGEKLAARLGKEFSPPMEDERIEGVYRRPVDLPSGRFALIEKAEDFTLLPWREALEKRRGLEVSGVLWRGGVSWTFGHERSALLAACVSGTFSHCRTGNNFGRDSGNMYA